MGAQALDGSGLSVEMDTELVNGFCFSFSHGFVKAYSDGGGLCGTCALSGLCPDDNGSFSRDQVLDRVVVVVFEIAAVSGLDVARGVVEGKVVCVCHRLAEG